MWQSRREVEACKNILCNLCIHTDRVLYRRHMDDHVLKTDHAYCDHVCDRMHVWHELANNSDGTICGPSGLYRRTVEWHDAADLYHRESGNQVGVKRDHSLRSNSISCTVDIGNR